MTRASLHRYAIVTAGATWLLLIAGSLVTSTDSGLAVPDWPLSYGTWFPPMVGGILYEHGHRMIAGVVGLMMLALAAWLWKVEPRAWVRRLGYAAAAAVILQALLGGLTVLWLLPPAISIAHAMLGQTVFCLVVCLAVATSPRWRDRAASDGDAPSSAAALRTRSLVVAVLAAAQVLLGAIIRHTGYAVGWHALNAILLVGLSIRLVGRAKRLGVKDCAPRLWAHLPRLGLLLMMQFVLGIMVWMHRASTWMRTTHVALGALVLAQVVVLAWETRRHTRPAQAPETPKTLAAV